MPTRTRILPIPMGVGPTPGEYYTAAQIDAMLLEYAKLATEDLANYYLKSQTYTQAEIEALVGQITSFEVVATLPTENIKTNVIYLLGPIGTGADKYEEYIYSNNAWKKIGETSIDLSNYVTITQLNTALGFYTTTQQLQTLLAGKQDTLTAGDRITISSNTISADSQIVSLTQQEYDALGTNVDPDVVYVITDASPVVLATVATTGDYDDLINKPTIPVVPTLATVATSGSYNDLTDKPSMPTGDVTASGNNTLTGRNTFTGYNTFTEISEMNGGITMYRQESGDTSVSYTEVMGGSIYLAYGDDSVSIEPQAVTVMDDSGNMTEITCNGIQINGNNVVTDDQLATVATSGSYDDLTDKPVIPVVPTLATVATTGAYSDLTGTPTIPTVGTGTVTLTSGGATIGTFGLNDSDDKTIDIPAGGGGGGNEWYGSQYQFDTLGTYDPDTDYYISDISYSEIKGTPNLSAYETKADSQAADQALDIKIAGKENSIVFLGTAGLPSIGTPLEGVTYAIEGETLPLTFTLADQSTVTYNFVID